MRRVESADHTLHCASSQSTLWHRSQSAERSPRPALPKPPPVLDKAASGAQSARRPFLLARRACTHCQHHRELKASQRPCKALSLQAGARRARPRVVAHRAAPRERLRVHGRAEAAGLPAARAGGRRRPVAGAGRLAGARRRGRRGRGLHAAAGDCGHTACLGSPCALAVSQCLQQRMARPKLAL